MPRRNVWFDARTDAELTAAARVLRVGRGEMVRVLMEMAGGNFKRLRHDARQDLSIIGIAVALLRARYHGREETEAMDDIARARENLAALLARQA